MHVSTFSTLFRTRMGRRLCLLVAFSLEGLIALAFSPADTDGNLPFNLMSVQRYLATDEVLTSLPTPALIGAERVVAFEDHEYFAYVCGTSQQAEQHGSELAGAAKAGIIRRIFYIRPQVIVIDSQVDARMAREIDWTLYGPELQNSAGEDVRITKDGLHVCCRSLLPQTATRNIGNGNQGRMGATHTAGQRDGNPSLRIRSLHVISFAKDREPALPTCSVARQSDAVRLEMVEENGTAADRTVRLWIPDGAASGRIEIVTSDGKRLVSNRLLPAGIFPPDLNAAQRRLQWDVPYQTGGQAIWDTGRPSSELKRLVESGQIKPCHAVEIGCGTGNDAIYLASQGFDVTAIDIAPTALNIAEQKAAKAGVRVNWLLADILHPPLVEPFDFVYDRGCYHEVRQHHPKAYVAAVQKLTHDASKILILAGNANKDSYWRFEGPPRVKEQDIRKDFASGFHLLHLREFRFDPAPPERKGALAWSILLEREQ